MKNFLAFLAAIILYYFAQPYFVWHEPMSYRTYLGILLGFFFFSYRREPNSKLLFLFFLYFIGIGMYSYAGGHNLNYFIALFPIVFVPFAKDDFTYEVYSSFLNIYTIIISVSLIVYVSAIFGLIKPITTIASLNELKSDSYSVYPLLVKYSSGPLIRFFGPFDEPGVVGTLSGILLCIEKLNLKNWRTVVLLVSGLCSLSLFFYLIIGIYYIIYISNKKHRTRNLVLYLSVVVLIAVLIQTVPAISDTIGRRLAWDSETMNLVGDNRLRQRDVASEYFTAAIHSDAFWFGIDNAEEYESLVTGSSSIINSMILYGVFFVLFYVFFYIFYAYSYRTDVVAFILFVLVFLGSLYQRPYIYNYLYDFLYVLLARIGIIESLTIKGRRERVVEVSRK